MNDSKIEPWKIMPGMADATAKPLKHHRCQFCSPYVLGATEDYRAQGEDQRNRNEKKKAGLEIGSYGDGSESDDQKSFQRIFRAPR